MLGLSNTTFVLCRPLAVSHDADMIIHVFDEQRKCKSQDDVLLDHPHFFQIPVVQIL